jgi:hypothetical protein
MRGTSILGIVWSSKTRVGVATLERRRPSRPSDAARERVHDRFATVDIVAHDEDGLITAHASSFMNSLTGNIVRVRTVSIQEGMTRPSLTNPDLRPRRTNGHGRDARPWPSVSFELNAGYRPLLPAEVSGVVEPVEPVPDEVVDELLFFSWVVVLVVSPEPEPP